MSELPLDSSDVVHRGFLEKKGDVLNYWRTRLLSLHSNPPRIQYYKQPFVTVRGVIPLDESWSAKYVGPVQSLPFVFSLECPRHSYLLSAPTEACAQRWVSIFNAVVQPSPVSAHQTGDGGEPLEAHAHVMRTTIRHVIRHAPNRNELVLSGADEFFQRRPWSMLGDVSAYSLMNQPFNELADHSLNRKGYSLYGLENGIQVFLKNKQFKGVCAVQAPAEVVARALVDVSDYTDSSLRESLHRLHRYGDATDIVCGQLSLVSLHRRFTILRHWRWIRSPKGKQSSRICDPNGGVPECHILGGGWSCWAHPNRSDHCVVVHILDVDFASLQTIFGLWKSIMLRITVDRLAAVREAVTASTYRLDQEIVSPETDSTTNVAAEAGDDQDDSASESVASDCIEVVDDMSVDIASSSSTCEAERIASSLKEEVLSVEEVLEKDGFRIGSQGGLQFVDCEEIAKQKGVLLQIMKKIGNNLIHGRSIISISMPVHVFEPRSFLERMTDLWGFAPVFLNRASREEDPVERFKLAIVFVVAGLHRGLRQQKPFNPILGEVHRASFSDGSQIYMEQVSHHPPISAFQVIGNNRAYHLHGHHEYKASLSANSAQGSQSGISNLVFHDGGRISYTLPTVLIRGTMFGDRILSWEGTASFEDPDNGLSCSIQFNPFGIGKSWFGRTKDKSERIDAFIGRLQTRESSGRQVDIEVKGSWLGETTFDDVVYLNIKECFSMYEKPVRVPDDHFEHILPSDARYRSDLVALKQNMLDEADSEKSRLESLQRQDRKWRSSRKQ